MDKANIFQRMHGAMMEIGTVKKDRMNTLQNYRYVSEEAIKTACHEAMVKHGIIFTLSGVDHRLDWRNGTNKDGKPIVTGVSQMVFEFAFTNIDDPSDTITGAWRSSAADNSDKSHTKAITYAIREILKSNFMISTGEADPDGETPEVGATAHEPAKATPKLIPQYDEMPWPDGTEEGQREQEGHNDSYDSGEDVCRECNGPVEIRKSSSEKNPGREYWYCAKDKFSHWVSR